MIHVRKNRPDDDGSGAAFRPGELVRHRRYGYRGVVVAADPRCLASDDWYRRNRTQPERAQPWYHVLVDGGAHVTYAAETSLESDPTPLPVQHPLLAAFFDGFADGMHLRNERPFGEAGP